MGRRDQRPQNRNASSATKIARITGEIELPLDDDQQELHQSSSSSSSSSARTPSFSSALSVSSATVVIGIHRQGAPIAARRHAGIALCRKRVSEIRVRHRQSRVERDGVRRIGDREIVLAFQVIRVGAIGEGDRVLRPERDGAVVTLDRGIEVTFLLIGGAEIAERGRELRVDGRRVLQRFNRAIEVPLPQEVDTPVHVRFRSARQKARSLSESPHRHDRRLPTFECAMPRRL